MTIPHKEHAANIAAEKDPAVELTQAANTLIRGENGFVAYNTDYQSARDSLLANLPPGPDGQPSTLQGRTVLLLGAGGVARAVAHALHREGALVSVSNRTPERTQRLAEEVGCRAIDWAARHNVVCDTVINCTSVGMHPNMDESPIHQSLLKPEAALLSAASGIGQPDTAIDSVDPNVRRGAQCWGASVPPLAGNCLGKHK